MTDHVESGGFITLNNNRGSFLSSAKMGMMRQWQR
jgi:hypothetical protein